MQSITIPIPAGHDADFDKVTGKVTFIEKPKKITERIKTIDDALNVLGGNDQDALAYEILSNTVGIPCHVIAHQGAIVFAKALNEGWTPDWSNHSEVKYYPYFEMRGSSGFRFHGYDHWAANSNVGSRLCFKSRELAEYAGKQFQHIYKSFMVIK